MDKIDENIKTIGTRSTWMLGFLIVIILAFANYLSKYIGVEVEVGSLIWFINRTVTTLCFIYLLMLLAYIWPLIVPNIKEQNAKVLEKLDKRFKSLIFLFIAAVPTSFASTLVSWHFKV